MEDKSNILLLVAGMRKEVQGLVSEVSITALYFVCFYLLISYLRENFELCYLRNLLIIFFAYNCR